MKKLLIFILLIFSPVLAMAQQPLSLEHAKIKNILAMIEGANAIFIRNGDEYTPMEARKHLERKLNWAGNRIKTADQFIIYLGSSSSQTGDPYYVLFPNGVKVLAGDWLKERLQITWQSPES